MNEDGSGPTLLNDKAPGPLQQLRARVVAKPGTAFAVTAVLVFLLASTVVSSHAALNKADPDVATARTWLVGAHVVAAAGALLLIALAGRNLFFLVPPMLLGALHLYDAFEQFLDFGLDAELGLVLTLLAVAHAVIAALGTWALTRVAALRPYAGWVPLAFLAAWVGAFLVIGPTLLADLNGQAQTIRQEWTNEHADPPAEFWAVVVAVFLVVAWARRRTTH